jgi:hypothetical protein
MMKFTEFRTSLSEASFKLKPGEKQVKKFKVGKGKYDAVVSKKGSDFIAYVDGDMLDKFKSAKEAEKAAKDFTDLMGK